MTGTAEATQASGLLGKLVAAVRPEFRADVLLFDPADPVFGRLGVCLVQGCGWRVRGHGLCQGHYGRWKAAGRPDLTGGMPAVMTAPWNGHGPVPSGRCRVAGCGFGVSEQGMCSRHAFAWRKAGQPDPGPWAAAQPAVVMPEAPPACLISYCDLWAHPGAALCRAHARRWKDRGRPDLAEFARFCEEPRRRPPVGERADLTSLPRQLRLELQYALQRRRDECTASAHPTDIRAVVRVLAESGAASLLALEDREWRSRLPRWADKGGQRAALVSYARRQVAALAEEGPGGWDGEYPRDTWRLRRLGIPGSASSAVATLRFGGISQPWLKDLAKRWTRWRISTGLSMSACYQGVRAVTRFSEFAAAAGAHDPHQADRDLLERYLAHLHHDLGGRSRELHALVGELATFLLAVRRHGWEPALPPSAMIFPGDYPARPRQLPRGLAAHVMAQAEDPANLDRWASPSCRLITVILIRCGLRISSAVTLPSDCVVADADGAPYLRYSNTKMKREALVPIDEEIAAMIAAQLRRNRERWPAGVPVLFPRPHSNFDGTRPLSTSSYRSALRIWLQRCDIRDEHGQPVHLTPHQWRHTLGTALINRDVPQHVVQKILDHDSPDMTAHYARLSDTTVRDHWEKARKVGATGQPVRLSPDGPLSDAAWTGHQLSRATQALPNGYCQLPAVKTCPHANACLTCPMFVTTAEFLPRHHAQRQATLQLITAAEAAGHTRVAEMNKQVAANLEKIITALQAGSPSEEAPAHAS